MKNKREKESAFIRKINDLYGEDVNNKLNNNNNNNEDYNKKEIEKYPNDNKSQIKKRLEYISDINKNNNSNENYNLNDNNNENVINKNYEIQFDKIYNVNIPEFKKFLLIMEIIFIDLKKIFLIIMERIKKEEFYFQLEKTILKEKLIIN